MKLSQFIEEVHRLAAREWAQQGTDMQLSYNEFEYLRAIQAQETKQTDKDNHGQHLYDVVAEMGVRKASASAMVLKLEERELVFRVPCKYDARAQHILLTVEGVDMLQAGAKLYAMVAKSIEQKLLGPNLHEFRRIIENLET